MIKQHLSQILVKLYKFVPFFVIVFLAFIFRFFYLGVVPGGLFPDEAANGLDVNNILNGNLQPFYERGNGREALFFYILTPFVQLFGRTPFAHHFTSALIALLTIIFTYFLVKRWFGKRVAVVTAFLAAVNSWYVVLSRTAFRAITTPLLIVLFLYLATRIAQAKNKKDYWLSSIGAGLAFAIGLYTYIPFRLMVVIVAIIFALLLVHDFRSQNRWQLVKKYYKAFFVAVASFIVGIFPLALYFIKNPEWLVGRSGQVSIFSPELNNGDLIGTFWWVLKETTLSFFVSGDTNWRHNISGFSHLSMLIAPLFLAGLIFVTAQGIIFIKKVFFEKSLVEQRINLSRLPYVLITGIFFIMLIPELLTAEGIPHGLRMIGVIPMIFIIPALFLEEIFTHLPHKKESNFRKTIINGFLILFLGAEMLWGAYLYFGIAAQSPDYAYAFRQDLTYVSQYLNIRNNKEQTYLVIDLFSEQTPQYLTSKTKQPYKIIDPASLWQGKDNVKVESNTTLGLNLVPGDQIIFTQSTQFDIPAFQNAYPEAQLIYSQKNRWQQFVIKVYQYKNEK